MITHPDYQQIAPRSKLVPTTDNPLVLQQTSGGRIVYRTLGDRAVDFEPKLLVIDTPQGTVRIKLVKPCVRCSIPGVDPDSGEQGFAVSDTLASYRADARMDGGVTFGMNAIVLAGAGCELAVGQRCRASYAF